MPFSLPPDRKSKSKRTISPEIFRRPDFEVIDLINVEVVDDKREAILGDSWPKIVQIWIYTLLVVLFVGGLVALLAQDWRFFFPIGGLSIFVGVIGTFLSIAQRYPRR